MKFTKRQIIDELKQRESVGLYNGNVDPAFKGFHFDELWNAYDYCVDYGLDSYMWSIEEDKQRITKKLLAVLRMTRDQCDLKDLYFNADKEIVSAIYEGGGTRNVNVAMDSGVAMIRDIMGGLK